MFMKIGHRGAMAYETENTLESFQRALDLGANAVEFDIRKSHDEELIVSHDDNLKRVFKIKASIKEVTAKRLKELTDYRILTLSEAIRFLNEKVENILIEVKESGCESRLLDLIKKDDVEDRVIITSFKSDVIINIRRLDKEIETGLIYSRFRISIETALKIGTQYIVPSYRLVNAKDIDLAHRNNLKVLVWTINHRDEAKRYIDYGVDGIISDRPDIFKEIV